MTDSKDRVTPIRRQTLTGLTVKALRSRILHGDFADGEPLRQDALAAELGVSRIPVREALRQLEAEGLVTFNPHRGAVVSTMSLDEIKEIFELRADIECDLLRRAIPNMTKDDDRRSAEVLHAFDHALEHGDVASLGSLNWQLHSTLYAPANRPVSLGVVRKLHQHSDKYMRMLIVLTHAESRAKQEHRALALAIRKRDVKRATAVLREHILSAGRSLVVFLEGQRSGTASKKGHKAAR